MRGGDDNSILRPLVLEEDGRVHLQDDDHKVGNHKGTSEYLNVENPEPGYFYRHEARKRAKILARAREGWTVCDDEGTERLGEVANPNLAAAGLDGTIGGADTVLMKIRHEDYQKVVERQAEAAARPLDAQGSGESWLSRDHLTGTKDADGKVIYHRRSTHGLTKE
jgi:hypothetical protein